MEIHEKSLVVAARNARCLSSSSPDWFQNALVLYDIYWSTIAALIQLFADCQKRKELYTWTNVDEFGRQNDLNAILATRFNLLNQIYSYNNPRCQSEDDEWINEQMKSVLLLGIHPSCSQDQCLCFGGDQLDIDNLVLYPFNFVFPWLFSPANPTLVPSEWLLVPKSFQAV